MVSPIARTTTITSLPASRVRTTRSATAWIRSTDADRGSAVLLDDDGHDPASVAPGPRASPERRARFIRGTLRPAPHEREEAALARSGRILVVDDDPLNRKLLEKRLRLGRATTSLVAADGKAGLATLADRRRATSCCSTS